MDSSWMWLYAQFKYNRWVSWQRQQEKKTIPQLIYYFIYSLTTNLTMNIWHFSMTDLFYENMQL